MANVSAGSSGRGELVFILGSRLTSVVVTTSFSTLLDGEYCSGGVEFADFGLSRVVLPCLEDLLDFVVEVCDGVMESMKSDLEG